jgi:hypothetical protein
MSFKVILNRVSTTINFPLRRLASTYSCQIDHAKIQALFDCQTKELDKRGYKYMSFKDYKCKHIATFEEYNKRISKLCPYEKRAEIIPKAYEGLCISSYSSHIIYADGGNPATTVW